MFKLIEKMKNFLNKIKNALIKAFGSLLDFLMKNGDAAVKVTNLVKDVVNNPAMDWAVALTPTTVDDKLLAKAKVIVPQVAVKVGLAMQIIKEADLAESEAVAFSKILSLVSSELPDEGKAIFYRELSGAIAKALSDGVVSTAEAIAIAQLVFKKRL